MRVFTFVEKFKSLMFNDDLKEKVTCDETVRDMKRSYLYIYLLSLNFFLTFS